MEEDIADIIDLTGEDSRPSSPQRFLPLREEGRELESLTLRNGLEVCVGMTIELHHTLGPHDVQFVRVRSIFKPGGDAEISIRGFGFARTRQLDGMLPRKLNEVALVAEVRTSDPSQWTEHASMAVLVSNIKCSRDLRITNAPFPEHRFTNDEYGEKGKKWVEDNAQLVCRSRYQVHFHGDNEKPYEWALVQINEDEADPEFKISDEQNLSRWRGGKVPGGSYSSAAGVSQPMVDLEGSSNHAPHLARGQQYTAGDVFAGAGGASRGIERAGLKLVFAVDYWDHAVETLRANFQDTRIYNMNVTDFITSDDTKCDVDILHLSPPCQFWSPAHTVAGKNDENNIAVLFSCGDLVKKFRPRLFTVEQTFGILSPKFSEYFNTLLHNFTCLNYSVRWKVTPLANYGVPQLRKRLLMIGSAPGEALPTFPAPTHNKHGTGGLKPWTTALSILAPLSSPTFAHHPLNQPKPLHPPKEPWDPSKLARTITTNGGQNYHWTGERDFTLLEYAVLQGFPVRHQFRGRSIKKQIGNAFAPSVVRVLYRHLVRWLLEQDGFGGGVEVVGEEEGVEYFVVGDDGDDDGGDGRDGREERMVVIEEEEEEEGRLQYFGSRYGSREQRLSDVVEYLGSRGPRQERLSDVVEYLGSRGARQERLSSVVEYLGSRGGRQERLSSAVQYLGSRGARQRLSEVVRSLNRAAKEEDEDELMMLAGLDDLSDTETLRDADGDGEEMDNEVVVAAENWGGGTSDDPYVI